MLYKDYIDQHTKSGLGSGAPNGHDENGNTHTGLIEDVTFYPDLASCIVNIASAPKLRLGGIQGTAETYAFYNNRYIDTYKLYSAINSVYSANGFQDRGFAKIDYTELFKYSQLQKLLCNYMNSSDLGEVDADLAAKYIFDQESGYLLC